MRTTFGSLLFEDYVPNQDDLIVSCLRQAGANVFCKTNTPEFGAKGITEPEAFGATRNPWNTSLTPAGSTGGGQPRASPPAAAGGTTWSARANDAAATSGRHVASGARRGMRARSQRSANPPVVSWWPGR